MTDDRGEAMTELRYAAESLEDAAVGRYVSQDRIDQILNIASQVRFLAEDIIDEQGEYE